MLVHPHKGTLDTSRRKEAVALNVKAVYGEIELEKVFL